jgi:asparagine synthetase B (glutamine-hydrolysing)
MPHEARVAILFSGGLDCSCLAALADRYLPQGEAIDLLNVGFENPRSVKAKAAEEALALKRLKKQGAGSVDGSTSQSARTVDSTFNVPDRVTGYESLAELRRIALHRHWNFVEVNVPFEEANARRSEILERMAPLDTVMDLVISFSCHTRISIFDAASMH